MPAEAGHAYIGVSYDPASIAKLDAETRALGGRTSKALAASTAGIGKTLVGLGAAFGAFEIGKAIGDSIKSAGEFQQTLNVLQVIAHATSTQMAGVSKEAIKLGEDMRLPATTAQTAAEAITNLVKSGLSLKSSMQAARSVLELATGAQIDNATAAKYAASVLNQFQLSGTHARQVVDILTAATKHSVGTLDDFAASFRYAGSAAHGAGFSLKDTAAALAELSNRGLLGSVAGTALAQAIRQLQHPSAAAAEEMKKLGLRVYDVAGRMKPLPALVDLFSKKLNVLNPKQKNLALNTLFTARSIQAARIVLTGGLSAYEKTAKAVNDVGIAHRIAEARTKGFSGSLNAAQSEAQTFAIELGQRLLPAATRTALGIASLFRVLEHDLPTAARVTGDVTGKLGSALGALKPLLIAGAAGFIAMKVAMLGYATSAGVASLASRTLNTAQILATEGTAGLALAQQGATVSADELAAAQATAAETAAAAEAAQVNYAVAVATGATANTQAALEAAAATAAMEAEGAAAVAVTAEIGAAAGEVAVLNAAFLATPVGWAALAFAGLVGVAALLFQTGDAAEQMSFKVTDAANATRDLYNAQQELKGAKLDLRQQENERQQLLLQLKDAQRIQRGFATARRTGGTFQGQKVSAEDLKKAGLNVQSLRIQLNQLGDQINKTEGQFADASGRISRDQAKVFHSFRNAAKDARAAAESALPVTKRQATASGRAALAAQREAYATKQYQKSIQGSIDTTEEQIRQVNGPDAAAKRADYKRTLLQQLAAEDLSKKINGIPSTHRINVFYHNNMGLLIRQAHELDYGIRDIPTSKSINIETFYRTHGTPVAPGTYTPSGSGGAPSPISPLLQHPGRWRGGPVSATRPYWVGEKGPELFVPKVAGAIMDAAKSASMAASPIPVGTTTALTANVTNAAIKSMMNKMWQWTGHRFWPGFSQPPVKFSNSLTGPDGSAGGVAWRGSNRHIALVPSVVSWIAMKNLDQKYRRTRAAAFELILHEWAHAFQSKQTWATKRNREGGAEMFGLGVLPGLLAGIHRRGSVPISDSVYPRLLADARARHNKMWGVYTQFAHKDSHSLSYRRELANKYGLARGGLVTGGVPGVDSVPALLKPGELVLNESQQRSLGARLGGDVTVYIGNEAIDPHLVRVVRRENNKTARGGRSGRKVAA